MCAEDLPAVMAIEQALFSDPWTQGMYEDEITMHEAWVLELGEEIAGMACGWRVLDEYQLTNIGIAPRWHRHGLARKLLAWVLARQLTFGCRVAYLEVRVSNEPAIGLYESFGFTVVGKRRDYYRHPVEDALVMAMQLKRNEPEGAQPVPRR